MRYFVSCRGRAIALTAAPDLPREIRSEPAEVAVSVPAGSRIEIELRQTARARGAFTLGGLHLALSSPLGLWRRAARIGAPREIHVYPNLKQLNEYALLARTNRLALIGVRSSRRTGGDTEFERLRDWHGDDPLNHIDWKATARRDLITSRSFQTTQSQSLCLMVDAGRMMVARSAGAGGETSMLDRAIDAALMLGYVALAQGDRVGLIAYADGVKRQVPSGRGVRQLNRLIHAVHDLHPRLVESRHEDAFLHLRRTERKRSLVVLLTHVIDDTNAEHLHSHVVGLAGRHLPLVVLLQDPDLHGALAAPPANEAEFWRAGAAAHIANWRSAQIERLTKAGALVVDAAPDRLTPAVVSNYLTVKARHLL
ncbi:MAG: DUF58 domain-containing protein [Planctomycetes bacterium]|nr:DUF58 domain-containing protein [Planctomycetota bacterium]